MNHTESKPDPAPVLLQQLQASDPLVARQAETDVRALEECPSTLVRGLIDILRSPEIDPALLKRTISLLSDIKFSALVPLLEQAIREEKHPAQLAYLLSIAWQNRLDFSPLLPLLTQHTASEHLQVAVEAATALEIAAEHASIEQLRIAVQQLKAHPKESLAPHAASLVAEMFSHTSTILQQKINAARELK